MGATARYRRRLRRAVGRVLRSRQHAPVWFGADGGYRYRSGPRHVLRARLQWLIDDHYWVGPAAVRWWLLESAKGSTENANDIRLMVN